jgi:class 3 adenylate cyclase
MSKLVSRTIAAMMRQLVNAFDVAYWLVGARSIGAVLSAIPAIAATRDAHTTGLATGIRGLRLASANIFRLDKLFAFVDERDPQPRLEERALLFVDLRGSTATAELLGGLRFLDFLNAVFADLSAAIAESGGEIHKYVGDEIIATWRLLPGRNEPRIVRAWVAARSRLASRADEYQREFGLAPDFRAALHAGEVVVGQLGSLKKELALIGDPMNTAARILDTCRHLNCSALASSKLIERLVGLPDTIECHVIAPLSLRGKSEPLELFALERTDAGAIGLAVASHCAPDQLRKVLPTPRPLLSASACSCYVSCASDTRQCPISTLAERLRSHFLPALLVEALAREAVERAWEGDAAPLPLRLNGLASLCRDRTTPIDMSALKDAADARDAIAAIVAATAEDELTPNESVTILTLLTVCCSQTNPILPLYRDNS